MGDRGDSVLFTVVIVARGMMGEGVPPARRRRRRRRSHVDPGLSAAVAVCHDRQRGGPGPVARVGRPADEDPGGCPPDSCASAACAAAAGANFFHRGETQMVTDDGPNVRKGRRRQTTPSNYYEAWGSQTGDITGGGDVDPADVWNIPEIEVAHLPMWDLLAPGMPRLGEDFVKAAYMRGEITPAVGKSAKREYTSVGPVLAGLYKK